MQTSKLDLPREIPPLETPITELLRQWSAGQQDAGDDVLRVLYGELRRIARQALRHEGRECTLQATALVHEAYLRLREVHDLRWSDRNHFLGLSAFLMRRILVQRARLRATAKRGGGLARVTLSDAAELSRGPAPDLLAVDEALTTLERMDPRKAKIVELRFFGGLTVSETAELLEVSVETVGREWRRARAWLWHELSCDGGAMDVG